MRGRLPVALIALVASVTAPFPLYSHEAMLDGFGCHTTADQKAYECHRGLLGGRSFSSKTEMLHALEGTRPIREIDGNPAELRLHSSRMETDQVCIRENFTKQVLCGTMLR